MLSSTVGHRAWSCGWDIIRDNAGRGLGSDWGGLHDLLRYLDFLFKSEEGAQDMPVTVL